MVRESEEQMLPSTKAIAAGGKLSEWLLGEKAPPMQVTERVKDFVKIRTTLKSANLTLPGLTHSCC